MNIRSPLSDACKKYEADLVLYYYAESDQAERNRVERHLSECRSCQRFIDDLRDLLPQLNKGPELPQNFWQSYYRETVAKLDASQARTQWWANLFVPVQQWFVPAFGTAAVIVLSIALLFAKGSLPLWKDKPANTLPQEVIVDGNQLEFFRSLDMLESLSQLEQRDESALKTKSDSLSFVIYKQSIV